MDKEFLIHLCGWVASIGLILGYLPQAIQTIRTRNTDGISLPGFIMMAIGCFAFVVQGLLIENYYLLLTNLITFTCSVIIFVIKMQNDFKKRKEVRSKRYEEGGFRQKRGKKGDKCHFYTSILRPLFWGTYFFDVY